MKFKMPIQNCNLWIIQAKMEICSINLAIFKPITKLNLLIKFNKKFKTLKTIWIITNWKSIIRLTLKVKFLRIKLFKIEDTIELWTINRRTIEIKWNVYKRFLFLYFNYNFKL